MFYLISNDSDLSESKINSLPLNSNDTVILFNHANPNRFDRIKYFKNKYLVMHHCGDPNTDYFWGLSKAKKEEYLYKKFIFIDKKNIDQIEPYIKKSFADIIDVLKFKKYMNYDEDKYPTSGFHAFFYLTKTLHINYDNICLINFTGRGSTGEGWNKHDYIFEQNFYKQNRICML